LTLTLQSVDSGREVISQRLYDAFGQLIETRRYDQFAPGSWIGVASGSLPIAQESLMEELQSLGYQDVSLGSATTDESTLAHLQRTRFVYDAANQLRYTVDAEGG